MEGTQILSRADGTCRIHILGPDMRTEYKMTSSAKRMTLGLLGLVMILTIVIAASLSQLELQRGMPLPSVEKNQVVVPSSGLQAAVNLPLVELFKALIALVLAGLLLFAIYRKIMDIGWRKFGSYLLPILIGILIFCSALFLILLFTQRDETASVVMPLQTDAPAMYSSLGSVPPALFWVVGIASLVGSALLGFWILKPAPRKEPAIALVARDAENAWQALLTGQDLKDVIVKCYRQMSLSLEKEQGIEREEFMTIREFERLLEAAGIPHDPVHQLTQLFELVRYGNWRPNRADEKKAIQSLEAIMVSSHVAKK
jgi:hypothetical protein